MSAATVLETAVIPFSQLERTRRLDAEYFQGRYRASAELIEKWDRVSVASVVHVSDGNHFTISDEFVDEGVPYYRGQDVTGRFFVETASPVHITKEAFNRTYMRRSHLRRGDVLLSIIGTIGELSLVASDQPATCSCKLAIFRPHGVVAEFLAVFLRSEHGQNQIARLTRGAVQRGLILEDMDQLWVPRVSDEFQKEIAGVVEAARLTQEQSHSAYSQAENVLLGALGLAKWNPPAPLSYTASLDDVRRAGRMDASFFSPRIQALLDILSRDGLTLSDVATVRRDRFDANHGTEFDYIEISNLDGDGAAGSTRLPVAEAPSRATWLVRPGDVITSTVRPIRRLSAQIAPEQNGFVCSSGFVVIQPEHVTPELLLTYLRLPIICELLDLYASASMYPAVAEGDVLGLPIPRISSHVAARVAAEVQAAREAGARAMSQIEGAKRAVELAIEQGEAAGSHFLAGLKGTV